MQNPAPKSCSSRPALEAVQAGEALACTESSLGRLPNVLRIVHHGRTELLLKAQDSSGKFFFAGSPAVPEGTDVTGSGLPELVVQYNSGAAHCCVQMMIFTLGDRVRLLASVALGDEGEQDPVFEPNHSGVGYHLAAQDASFANWPMGYAGSVFVPILLRPASAGGKLIFHLDPEEMGRQPPAEEQWQKESLPAARAALSGLDEAAPGSWRATVTPDLWSAMLDWIYGGQAGTAWKLLDQAWPASASAASKEDFLQSFCSRLAGSPYFTDLHAQLAGAPEACQQGLRKPQGQPGEKPPAFPGRRKTAR